MEPPSSFSSDIEKFEEYISKKHFTKNNDNIKDISGIFSH